MIRGDYQKLLSDLKAFDKNVGGRGTDDLGLEFAAQIINAIHRHGNIDTTAMVHAIDYHRQHVIDGYGFTVDTSNNPDVFYDGFVELPRKGWPGSFFYQEGIERARVEEWADDIVRRTFI